MFTIDFWAQHTNSSRGEGVFSHNTGQWNGLLKQSLPYRFTCHFGELVFPPILSSGDYAANFPANTLTHYRLTRDASSVIRFFLDGQLMATDSTHERRAAEVLVNTIGAGGNGDGFRWLGYFDEFLILDGECLSTSSFTPPAEPYADPVV